MTTRLSAEFRRRLLYGPAIGEEVVTLTIHVESARRGWAGLRITLDDKDGIELVNIAEVSAQEGTTVSLTNLSRCFDIRIS